MDEKTRERFLLVSKTKKYKKRVKEAEEALVMAMETCDNPSVSFSFGKDSLVCMDMALKINPDILVVNIDRGKGGDIKEAVTMYEEYAKERNINYHRVKTPREIFDIYKEAGTIDTLDRKDLKNNLIKGVKTARKQLGIDCEILGLRAEESRARSYLYKYGTFHYSSTEKIYKCKPILRWTGVEIWAYIIDNNLPYISWYDQGAQFEGYSWTRYSNWAGLYMAHRGRFVMLKKNYPDEFRELAQAFPEVKKYV